LIRGGQFLQKRPMGRVTGPSRRLPERSNEVGGGKQKRRGNLKILLKATRKNAFWKIWALSKETFLEFEQVGKRGEPQRKYAKGHDEERLRVRRFRDKTVPPIPSGGAKGGRETTFSTGERPAPPDPNWGPTTKRS